MASKDLTDALRALMEQSNPSSGADAMKTRGAAGKSSVAKPLGGGGSGSGGTGFTIGGEKIVQSSDGLFEIRFPATLVATIDGTTVTVGVIEIVS